MGDPPRILGPGHASLPPGAQAVGDIEAIDLPAGQGVGLVIENRPATEVIRELVAGARRIIEGRLGRAVGSAQKWHTNWTREEDSHADRPGRQDR